MNAKRTSDARSVFFVWGATVLVLFLTAAVMPQTGFWITDGGNKRMVLEQFLRKGTADMTPEDPEAAAFFPDAFFHFQHCKGKIYSVFPPYFPLVSSIFVRTFGEEGKYLIPLFAAALAAALFLRLLEVWRVLRIWLLPAAVFATPVAFYAVEFWEMVPGMVPVLAMMFLLARQQVIPAGFVLACGLWFRPEMFFFAAVAWAALILNRPRRAMQFAAGFLAGFLPYAAVQMILFGSIPGIHGNSYARDGRHFLDNYRYYFFSFSFAEACFAIAAFLLGCAPHFRRFAWSKTLLLAAVLVCGLFRLKTVTASPEPVFQTIFTVGLFTMTPFWYMVLANWRPLWNIRREGVRTAARITFLYTLVLPPLLTSSDWGIIWGARHWIFVMMPGAALAWIAARTKTLKTMAAGLLLLSFAFQMHGLRIQYRMRENTVRLAEFLQNSRETVLSDVYFLPMLTPERFFDRKWFFVKNDDAFREAVKILREKNIPFTFVRSALPGHRLVSNDAARELLNHFEVKRKPQTLHLPETCFLDMSLFDMQPRQEKLR